MKHIAFAGTFDPFTLGHLWVLKEGLAWAEHLFLILANNPSKKTMFNLQERKDMISETLRQENLSDRVTILEIENEYVSQKVLDLGCSYMIRGLRNAVDFEYEQTLSFTNEEILDGAKTVFVMTPAHLKMVSSSYIKGFIGPKFWHLRIKPFVPSAVYVQLLQKDITRLCHEFGFNGTVEDDYLKEALAAYSEPHRQYHTLEHLLHGLQEIQAIASQLDAELLRQLLIAWIGHDVVYELGHAEVSNEVRSGRWVELFFGDCPAVQAVYGTEYTAENEPQDELCHLLCSIDLSILGQKAGMYKAYSDNIRKEYQHVPEAQYIEGRTGVLELMLNRVLFKHPLLAHYETTARQNLENELAGLRGLQI